MAALTAARNTPERAGDVVGYPVKASVKPIQGGIAVLTPVTPHRAPPPPA